MNHQAIVGSGKSEKCETSCDIGNSINIIVRWCLKLPLKPHYFVCGKWHLEYLTQNVPLINCLRKHHSCVYSHVTALTSVIASISPQIPEMKAFSVCVRVFGGSERAGGYGSGELIWKPDTPEKVTQEAPGQSPMEQEPQKAPVREAKRMPRVKSGCVFVQHSIWHKIKDFFY